MSVPSVDEHGNRRATKKERSGVRAFGRNLLVLAAIPLSLGVYGVVRGYLTLQWPRTDAQVLDSNTRVFVDQSTRNATALQETRTVADIRFTYLVDGRRYVSEEIEPYSFGIQNSALAKKHKERYPAGATAPVAYNADDPSVAYLEPGPSATAMMLAGVGAFMTLCGFWIMWCAKKGIGRMA